MAKNPELPPVEWLNSLTREQDCRLIGWLYQAAESKPQIAAEFAHFARHLETEQEDNAAASSTDH